MSGCQAYHQPAVKYDGLLYSAAEAPLVLAHASERFGCVFWIIFIYMEIEWHETTISVIQIVYS